MTRSRSRSALLFASAALFIASCSGGSSSEPDDASQPTTPSSAAESEDESPDESSDAAGGDSDEGEVAPLEDEDQLTSEGEGADTEDLVPQQGGEITWALGSDGTGFDTTSAVRVGSIRVITTLSDPLVTLDVNADWQPNLAESLTPNEDFTSWTITMRPGIEFHDGEPVNAEAVRANLQAYKDSSTVGFALGPVETITAIDERSVQVDMNSPWAAFPYSLIGQLGWMVSPSTIGTNETFVGTGPFMLESWVARDSARVVRNPNYWRDGLPYLDAIDFKFVVEQTVRRQAFDAGDVLGFHSPSAVDIVEFLDDDEIDVWIGTAGANEFYWILNTLEAPLDDVRVRRAIAHAIDVQFLIDIFREGLTTPADGPLNPSNRWYSENNYPDFDPAAAQALVDEYEAEVGPIEFAITAESNSDVLDVLEVVVSFLSDVGIDMTIEEIGPGQSVSRILADEFQAVATFGFGAPDPDDFYRLFHSSMGPLNISNLVSEGIDEGLELGRSSTDEASRAAGYAQFLNALGDEVPMIWFDHLNGVEAVTTIPEIHGIGVPGTLPDGGAQLPMTNGVFFSWHDVWLEQ